MKSQNIRVVLLSLGLVIFAASQGWSSGNIKGTFIKKSGTEIVATLDIDRPAPASVILKIKIPGGIDILSSSPTPRKFKRQNGVVKYLFKRVSPGRHIVKLKLAAPVKASRVRGEIRYRDKETSTMMTVKFD